MENLRFKKGKKYYKLSDNALNLIDIIESAIMVPIVWGAIVALIILL